jgi:hypothetical protein
MAPGLIVRVSALTHLVGNPRGSLGVCWQPENELISWFLFQNGSLVPLGWRDFYRLTLVVGFDNVACEALSILDLRPLSAQDRRAYYQEIFTRPWPALPPDP